MVVCGEFAGRRDLDGQGLDAGQLGAHESLRIGVGGGHQEQRAALGPAQGARDRGASVRVDAVGDSRCAGAGVDDALELAGEGQRGPDTAVDVDGDAVGRTVETSTATTRIGSTVSSGSIRTMTPPLRAWEPT